MMSLPDHPEDDAEVTQLVRWTPGRIAMIALVDLALIAIIVLHATGIVGG